MKFKLKLQKWHGLGNDFLIADCRKRDLFKNLNKIEVIKKLSDRHFGIGCDQFVTIEKGEKMPFVRFYNADGSESGMCGNATRCVAKILFSSRLATRGHALLRRFINKFCFTKKNLRLQAAPRQVIQQQTISFQTIAKTINCEILQNRHVNVEMGKISVHQLDQMKKELIQSLNPIAEYTNVYYANIGNPHLVMFFNISSSDLFSSEFDIDCLGRSLQSEYQRTNGINVEFVIINNRNSIYMRVYERGVGETLACGSGACAAVAAGIRAGLLDHSVNVIMKGSSHIPFQSDSLKIEWTGNDFDSVYMSGSATKVGDLDIEIEYLKQL